MYSEPTLNPFDSLSESSLLSNSYFLDGESKLKGFKVAYVAYSEVKSLEAALLNSKEKTKIASNKETPIATGLKSTFK